MLSLATSYGDLTYNTRRNVLGAIPLTGKIAYHLWIIEYSGQRSNYDIKLLRKSRWPVQHKVDTGIYNYSCSIYWSHIYLEENWISSFDFNPTGDTVATFGADTICSISDMNTDNCIYHQKLGERKSLGNVHCEKIFCPLISFSTFTITLLLVITIAIASITSSDLTIIL